MKKPERGDLNRGERLAFAAGGFFAIAYGYGEILRGKTIYTNWQGLDVSGALGIFLGVLCLLVSVFPWSRIHFLWDAGRKKHRR